MQRLRLARSSASSPACSRDARSNDHEKRVVAYHEAGHALCGELLPSVDRVHRISIVPRGRALGYTLNLPEEDRYLKTREELIDYMTVLLGGRVAEQIVFGAITTGASDDLKRVAEIAHAMVHEYAMGTERRPSLRAIDDGAVGVDAAGSATRSGRSWPTRRAAPPPTILDAHRDKLDELARAAARARGARARARSTGSWPSVPRWRAAAESAGVVGRRAATAVEPAGAPRSALVV